MDKQLERRFGRGHMPMETLHEAYVDGALDIPDLEAFLDSRAELVDFKITLGHLRFLVTRMIPEWLISSAHPGSTSTAWSTNSPAS